VSLSIADALASLGNSNPVLTGTPLDRWVGGLPRNALTCIGGDVGVGKSSVLRGIGAGLLKKGRRVLFVSMDFPDERMRDTLNLGLGVHLQADTVEEIAEALKSARVEDVLIDDMSRYAVKNDEGLASSARVWSPLLRSAVSNFGSVVVASTTRRSPLSSGKPEIFGGKGVAYLSSLSVVLRPVASLSDGPSIVVEMIPMKIKNNAPDAFPPLKLEVNPSDKAPLRIL
jgi:hypothetical protein